MTDFLLELRSEEIPARMQARARDDLARLFAAELDRAGLRAAAIVPFATPRRLALIARDLPDATAATAEEVKGPRTSAPPQALDGFLRKTGLTRDQLTERDGVFFAVTQKPGRATTEVLADAIPAIIRAFPWPKSMRWGDASLSTDSLRWVRPLHGIVALFGEEIVPVEIASVVSGAATLGHRFHHPGPITVGSAADYVEKLHACHVIVDGDERARLIRDRATELAAGAGLEMVADEGLVAENAGLTEWPVPLLGRFDEAFLAVPPEVIQLTARVNQKYFVCKPPLPAREGPGVGGTLAQPSWDSGPTQQPGEPCPRHGSEMPGGHFDPVVPSLAGRGVLANAFICTANIDAADGGARIVEGNRKVLAARLADARFFYEQDLKVPLEDQANKLDRIVFHEKLGTVADKVDRVAKLARWLVEEGIVGTPLPAREGPGVGPETHDGSAKDPPTPDPSLPGRGVLAALAERAARLCKADLVTGMVGEFPELQGVMGGYYARAQGEPDEVADAIRDHYKPVGQGDEVPTAPVTVAVSLADKLDTLVGFFGCGQPPTGSKDPFALRRAAIATIQQLCATSSRVSLQAVHARALQPYVYSFVNRVSRMRADRDQEAAKRMSVPITAGITDAYVEQLVNSPEVVSYVEGFASSFQPLLDFFADRLKVQQREAGVRHDLIDAVFALGGEDDLVRLLARVRALQQFVGTPDGANLLTGYRRAANILKKEGYATPLPTREGPGVGGPLAQPSWDSAPTPDPVSGRSGPRPDLNRAGHGLPDTLAGRGEITLSYTPEIAEAALHAALDSAEPAAADAVAREDFAAAMMALASLRAPIDRFFEAVTVNDPDPAKRAARLRLLARMRDAVHAVADFSRIEG